ncbi:MAG: helix-turn-helix domain-containing protein [Clostridia bacterium]|nr:helix-turn-helix domain-containing protein [Clostridia bacterium]
MDESLFISIEECAKLFNVGRNTMLRITKMHKFPAIFLKGKTLIIKSKIQNWIDTHTGYCEK